MKEVDNYRAWHISFNYAFPELHLNDEIRRYGSGLYSFNAADFPKEKKEEEILYHFYNLYDMIFGKGRLSEKGQLSEPSIDLFFNESLGVSIAIAAKFCSDIHPSGSDDYSCITEQSFKMLYEDDFIDELFCNIFFGHHVKKRFV